MTEEHEQRAQRLARLNALRMAGRDPYRVERYDRTHAAADIAAHFDELEGSEVRIAGRIPHPPRVMGKASFMDLRDASGRVQVYFRRDDLGDEAYAEARVLDYGDIAGVRGVVFRTRTGEPSVHASEISLLAKCLRPLPIGKERGNEHFGGLHDVEQRCRMRYADLLANPLSRSTLEKRCRLVSMLRRSLDARGFLEVETPVLQQIAGGAAARPFQTHHNALGCDLKLRISLELPLKRLIVGGFEKVYEIGRVFRNEGVSTRHSPEFTLLEVYQAYTDLDGMMDLVEDLYTDACVAVNGAPRFSLRRQREGDSTEECIDLGRRPWRRLSILDGIEQYAGVSRDDLCSLDAARAACDRLGVPHDRENSVGGIVEKLHELYTQPTLLQPTFITDFPLETSPLAKLHPTIPGVTRRFEVYIAGQELGNAFSEINDPVEQRARFDAQQLQRVAGDEEAHPMDEDFLRALEYGMPPTGGFGGGIDRLAMVLTGAASLRDVILFPLMRPEAPSEP
ncbi:MAG TPA: lysine--tRNA ligase [Chthonomonadales bacterium]|nr:lysine--tRNA ligase [Chthonomonadales bacterium]